MLRHTRTAVLMAALLILVIAGAAWAVTYGKLSVGAHRSYYKGFTVDGAGNVQAVGTFRPLRMATKTISADSYTCSIADYGKTLYFTYAGAVTVTLPGNGAPAGSWFRCVNANSDTTAPTYAAATADTLIAPNDAQADSVTFATGHRIGSCVRFQSNGSYWVAVNESTGCTMTITTD